MNDMLRGIYFELGIGENHLAANRLTLHEQPDLEDLQVVDIDFEGKPFILTKPAGKAWARMCAQARQDDVLLLPFSGFRSYRHQRNLIARHLKSGRALDDILTHIAIPGYSEHHSGRAVDIHADGQPALDEAFESTDAFAWLMANADGFGFSLSYPRGNPLGIVYEPWHWCFGG